MDIHRIGTIQYRIAITVNYRYRTSYKNVAWILTAGERAPVIGTFIDEVSRSNHVASVGKCRIISIVRLPLTMRIPALINDQGNIVIQVEIAFDDQGIINEEGASGSGISRNRPK